MFPEVTTTGPAASSNPLKSLLDQQMALKSVSRHDTNVEKARDKERMDALLQRRNEEDRQVEERKKQQQEMYRMALEQQIRPAALREVGVEQEVRWKRQM